MVAQSFCFANTKPLREILFFTGTLNTGGVYKFGDFQLIAICGKRYMIGP